MLKKLKRQYVSGFIFLILIPFSAFAENYILGGNYYIRSSTDFMSPGNRVGVLQEGSTFRVLNRFPQKHGAEALEIEVTAMSRGSYLNPSSSGRLFIYKPANSNDFIYRSGSRVEAGVSKCDTCASNITEISTTILTQISDTVIEMQNVAPKAEVKLNDEDQIPVQSGPPISGSLDQKIRNYSDSKEVSRMIEWAMKNKSPSSRRLCYRTVKEAMASQCGPPRRDYVCRNPFAPEGGKKGPGNNLMKSVSTDVADSYALSAKTRLKKDGFVNLLEIEPYKSQMRSPSQAPKGAVLVYSSGIPCGKISDCGHIEIKTGKAGEPGYVSDFYLPYAINETPRAKRYGSNYKLVGIMIKPKDGK